MMLYKSIVPVHFFCLKTHQLVYGLDMSTRDIISFEKISKMDLLKSILLGDNVNDDPG
jgi:hypothetical protein